MQRYGLLAVDEHGGIEVAEEAAPAALAHDGGEGRQHPLRHPVRVLGRQVQLETRRVEGARPHPEGVEQRVLGVPRPFARFRGRPHSIEIQSHRSRLASVDSHLRSLMLHISVSYLSSGTDHRRAGGGGGHTSRRIRSFQTLGLLPRPALRGRTGLYGPDHLERLVGHPAPAGQGFSLESLDHLFGALDAGQSLAAVLGLPEPAAHPHPVDGAPTTAELYGFAELQPHRRRGVRRPFSALVPTTMWDESEAS